jgi:hypothetical protein
VNNKDVEKLQTDLNRLGEWAVENAMEINPMKSTAISFTTARVNEPLSYSLRDTAIPEASSSKYLGIILRSDLSCADQVNYTVKKAWKALHFTVRILKKGNSDTESLAYTSQVRPILEYGATCRDPYREGQINASDRVQKKAAKFAHHRNDSNWETLAQRGNTARTCTLFTAHTRLVAKCMLPERGRSRSEN